MERKEINMNQTADLTDQSIIAGEKGIKVFLTENQN